MPIDSPDTGQEVAATAVPRVQIQSSIVSTYIGQTPDLYFGEEFFLSDTYQLSGNEPTFEQIAANPYNLAELAASYFTTNTYPEAGSEDQSLILNIQRAMQANGFSHLQTVLNYTEEDTLRFVFGYALNVYGISVESRPELFALIEADLGIYTFTDNIQEACRIGAGGCMTPGGNVYLAINTPISTTIHEFFHVIAYYLQPNINSHQTEFRNLDGDQTAMSIGGHFNRPQIALWNSGNDSNRELINLDGYNELGIEFLAEAALATATDYYEPYLHSYLLRESRDVNNPLFLALVRSVNNLSGISEDISPAEASNLRIGAFNSYFSGDILGFSNAILNGEEIVLGSFESTFLFSSLQLNISTGDSILDAQLRMLAFLAENVQGSRARDLEIVSSEYPQFLDFDNYGNPYISYHTYELFRNTLDTFPLIDPEMQQDIITNYITAQEARGSATNRASDWEFIQSVISVEIGDIVEELPNIETFSQAAFNNIYFIDLTEQRLNEATMLYNGIDPRLVVDTSSDNYIEDLLSAYLYSLQRAAHFEDIFTNLPDEDSALYFHHLDGEISIFSELEGRYFKFSVDIASLYSKLLTDTLLIQLQNNYGANANYDLPHNLTSDEYEHILEAIGSQGSSENSNLQMLFENMLTDPAELFATDINENVMFSLYSDSDYDSFVFWFHQFGAIRVTIMDITELPDFEEDLDALRELLDY